MAEGGSKEASGVLVLLCSNVEQRQKTLLHHSVLRAGHMGVSHTGVTVPGAEYL